MNLLWGLLLLTGVYPLGQAWRANRRTTLRHALAWTWLAWLAWMGLAWSPILRADGAGRLGAYLALSLTGCCGIAVLGARRPGASAWNFVVGSLLAVLLLPVLNGLGELRLETAQLLFLGMAVAVPLLNYLPTRLGPAVVLMALSCALLMTWLVLGDTLPSSLRSIGLGLVALSPWIAWGSLRRRRSLLTEFDRLWLAQRDRFGFVWGQRMREQFNRAAAHAGWPVELRWEGLHTLAADASMESEALQAILHAVGKRFTFDDEQREGSPNF